MVEIFSPWRDDIASAVVQKWPCVLRPYNLLCTMFRLTSFRTNKFVFTVLVYLLYLIAEGDYAILLMMPSWERTERDVEIKPSSVLAGGFHNFDRHLSFVVQKLLRCHPLWRCTFEFKGGKQILIEEGVKWLLDLMLCCLSGNHHGFAVKRSLEVNTAWKASFHTQIWQLKTSLFLFLIKPVRKFQFLLRIT